ncbi:MAG TPA: XRE family transcriptional regulator [Spirochaetia bacterium]|nr:XRE family transcriptional regulator [Spirochaetia bacterium]
MKKSKITLKIGKRIIQLREEKGITSEKLAFISGVSKNALRYIERNLSDPRISTLEQIAYGLNISLLELLDFPKDN